MSSHCVMNGYVIQMFWSNCKCSYVHFKVFTLKCLHVFFLRIRANLCFGESPFSATYVAVMCDVPDRA